MCWNLRGDKGDNIWNYIDVETSFVGLGLRVPPL